MADVVIVGAGPVGLWTALQIKKRRPEWEVQIYERHEVYQRSHVLRLDHWSMLLYGKTSSDSREQQFIEQVCGVNFTKLMMQPAKSLYIRTNDLEAAMKSYAVDMGIKIERALASTHQEVQAWHPECTMFIAADGAHSKMRASLLGADAVEEHPLQHIVELKYQVHGKAGKMSSVLKQLKVNSRLKNMGFEYVGKEREGVSPVTMRIFMDEKSYHQLPQATFKNPLAIEQLAAHHPLRHDIQTYLQFRQAQFAETIVEGSAKMTKLILSLYCSREFVVQQDNAAWFIVGDAAMGVPYFRALNCGMILGSRLGQILCSNSWPIADKLDKKAYFYSVHRPMHIATEFAIARAKDVGLNSYDAFRKLSQFFDSEQEVVEPASKHKP